MVQVHPRVPGHTTLARCVHDCNCKVGDARISVLELADVLASMGRANTSVIMTYRLVDSGALHTSPFLTFDESLT